MIDAIVSQVLVELTSIAVSEVEQEVRLVIGVEEEVGKLKSNLLAIQEVLAEAEERQLKETGLKQWLKELKAASYDMEDVLDEWNTAILKSKIEGDYQKASKPKRKVWSFLQSPCFTCCEVNVGLRSDIAHKIEELNERLDVIAKQKASFDFKFERRTQPVERQITASVVDVSEIEGRDDEKDELIGMLLGESSQRQGLQIISIVGMGGIGKTTLAQLVCNDDKVASHFEKIVWVCVSDPFEEVKIANAILESLLGSKPNVGELDNLLRQIQQSACGKRIFLVLDDVWEEKNPRKWKQIEGALKSSSPGSKVLVTTRKENVAKIMGCTEFSMFRLGQLSNEKCWSMFSKIAFFERSNGECKSLEDVGREIVNRCQGLPLAVKTLGSLLRFKESREQWQSVLNSKLWELEGGRQILAPLWLSYYDLPLQLQPCFSYCAMFPKDRGMSKDSLIKLWMAQGYLRETKGKSMEIVGEEYFKNLALRSFFQNLRSKYGDLTCKMHDIVHDLAQQVRENECISMSAKVIKDVEKDLCKEVRHLMIEFGQETQLPSSVYNLKKLRSLVCVPNSVVGSMDRLSLADLFNQLTCLRSLDLNNSKIREMPSTINKLIHLRSLDVSGNILEELPESVYELYNLQSFHINDCRYLAKLPHGIEKLINLRHLKCWDSIQEMPKGVGRLTGLMELDQFIVSRDGSADGCAIRDLKNLNFLRGGISITGLGNVTNINDAKEAQLKEKKDLIRLAFNFSSHGDQEAESRKLFDEELLEALEPSSNLECLVIFGYMGTTLSPNWMKSLTNLKQLVVFNCKNCQQLPDEFLQETTLLQRLAICNSPILEELYAKDRGENWPKISHIPYVKINFPSTTAFEILLH